MILYKVKNSVNENTSCGNFNTEETLTAAQRASKSMEWKIKCLIFLLKGHEFYVTSYASTKNVFLILYFKISCFKRNIFSRINARIFKFVDLYCRNNYNNKF